jgi:hypothetical protein
MSRYSLIQQKIDERLYNQYKDQTKQNGATSARRDYLTINNRVSYLRRDLVSCATPAAQF